MSRVNWTDVSDRFEDMVSVLIANLHPEAQRVDGRGGDGGRDVQVETPDGLIVYELKGFTGRLGKAGGRRRQVERSLSRSASLGPTAWRLTAPIDPTPAEYAWFQRLQSKYSFALAWLGKTWLGQQTATHPQDAR